MASSTRKRNLTQFVILIVAVVVIVAGSIAFQKWWNDRPGPDPKTVTLQVSAGNEKMDVHPYTVCEAGVECPQGQVAELKVGDNPMKISLPSDVYDHDWSLLKIYDDPAANDQMFFKGNEKKEVEIPAQSESGSRLVVVEVSSLMIGEDAQGVETPYTVVWSVNAKQ
ncbi:DUF2771 domain-containing protein [Corynebacterium epidermidicanis]|uniref:Putative DUF2771 family protein n=1 Tax=Corynebacterium epidermidicanis TaxID=1050174 RepID=A0A0G3GSR3_9CORY|nr:DUF2771 domain-containing protein [Corynebacterium epidermidicanis]AKK02603.1 putative DUF2771 family protein [Corynebacterium epidermidicanis]